MIILSHTSGLGVKGLTRLPYEILRYEIRHKNEKGTYNLKGKDGKPDVASDVLRRLQGLCISDVNASVGRKISRRERITRRVVHQPDVKRKAKKKGSLRNLSLLSTSYSLCLIDRIKSAIRTKNLIAVRIKIVKIISISFFLSNFCFLLWKLFLYH